MGASLRDVMSRLFSATETSALLPRLSFAGRIVVIDQLDSGSLAVAMCSPMFPDQYSSRNFGSARRGAGCASGGGRH